MSDRPSVRLAFFASLLLAASSPPAAALTLREAVARALERSPEARAAAARAEESAASARAAGAALQPAVSLSTTPGWASGMPTAVVEGRLPALLSIEARQALFSPTRRADALEAEAAAAREGGELARARASLARRVVLAWVRCGQAPARIAGASGALAAAERLLARVRARAAEGRATELEVARRELDAATARHALLAAESERDIAELELRRLADVPDGEPLELGGGALDAVPEPRGSDALARALAGDPVLAGLARAEACLAGAARLRGRPLLPEVEAGAQYQRLARYNDWDRYFRVFTPDSWSVGVSVALPVFTSGRLAAGSAAGRARLERAREERRARGTELEIRARSFANAASEAAIRLGLLRREAALASESVRLARLLAEEGRGAPDAVDEAEGARAHAEARLLDGELAVVSARLDLLETRGELPEAVEASPP